MTSHNPNVHSSREQTCRPNQRHSQNKRNKNVGRLPSSLPVCFAYTSSSAPLARPLTCYALLTAPRVATPLDNEPFKTVCERSSHIHNQGHPYASSLAAGGPSGLSSSERTLWANAHFARTPALLKRLGNKAQRDVWKCVNEAGGLPLRSVKQVRPTGAGGTPAAQTISGGSSTGEPDFTWGRDRFGADLGYSTPEQLDKRSERALQLSALEIQHSIFLEKKEREKGSWLDPKTNEAVAVTADEVEEEKLRRKEIARLRMELYGERTGDYGTDPTWDDVVPMPIEEPEGALAAIAYPEEYAEGPTTLL